MAVDFITAILTGLFTGIGVGIANYINETRTRKFLEHIDSKIDQANRNTVFGKMNNNGRFGGN